MNLKKIKQKLALDQRNIITCTVVNDKGGSVLVRSSKGELRTAGKPAGLIYTQGQRVQVSTDGSAWRITETSPYRQLAGELIVEV